MKEYSGTHPHATFSAQNGSKALQFVRANKTVCLVVLDYRMPDTDGEELARSVKRMRPMIPIMMLSDEEVKHRPLQCIDVYVGKGWPTDYFITLVETLTKSAGSNPSRSGFNEGLRLGQRLHPGERKSDAEHSLC